jgi:hypothetical protein
MKDPNAGPIAVAAVVRLAKRTGDELAPDRLALRHTPDPKRSFVLQGSETVENGKIKATWFVVPRSGTGELSRLRGEGGFEGEFGKGSNGNLEYWFE